MSNNEVSICRGVRHLVTGFLANALLVSIAGASTITTTSTFNTWKSAAYLSGAPSELNFLAINSSSYDTPSGITLSSAGGAQSATFIGMNGSNYSLAGDIYNKTLADSSSAGAKINILFQNPQNAFMVFFANPAAISYTVTLSDGQSFATSAKSLGFSLSYMVTGLTVAAAPGNQAVLNDFFFGMSSLAQDPVAPGGDPSTATPEPATILLLAGGCAAARWKQAPLGSSAVAPLTAPHIRFDP